MAILKTAFSEDLSSGPLLVDIEFQYDVLVHQVLLTASVDIVEDLSITYVDIENGSNYNVLIRQYSLNNESEAALLDIKFRLRKGDKIRIECTNANATGTVYGTIQVEADV